MESTDLARKTAHLNALLEQKLGLRKGPLGHRADKAGRRLPAWLRRDLHRLDAASRMAGNPRLARMADPGALERAYSAAVAHLKTIDPKERRKDRLIGIAGGLAFNLLLLAALVLAVLRWQGMI